MKMRLKLSELRGTIRDVLIENMNIKQLFAQESGDRVQWALDYMSELEDEGLLSAEVKAGGFVQSMRDVIEGITEEEIKKALSIRWPWLENELR